MADFQIDLELITKQFDASLSKSIAATNKFAKSVDNNFDTVNKSIKSSSTALNSFIGNLGASVVQFAASGLTNLAAGFTSFTKSAVLAAVDAQETASKFEAVFSTISEASNKTAKDLQVNFGLGVNESKELLSATGDLLTGFGFAQEGALALSSDVQKVAVDLASFTNFSGGAKGASEAITKALLGERETLKSLGVSIQEKAVQDQVAINNAKGLTFETDQQARAQATLDLIMKQSVNAIGDYARTSGGAANQLKLFNKRVTDLTIAFGDNFLPIIEPIVKSLNEFIETLNIETINQFVKQGIISLINGFSLVIQSINPVINSIKNIGLIFNIIQNGITAGISTIAGAFAGMAEVVVNIIRDMVSELPDSIVPDGWKEGLDKASEDLSKETSSLSEKIQIDANDMKESLNGILNPENVISDENIEAVIARATLLKDGVLAVQTAADKAEEDRANKILADKKKRDTELAAVTAKNDAEKLKKEEFFTELFGKQVSARTAYEEASGKERAQNLKSTLSYITTLSESNNNTLATIGKAAAITNATIDGYAAVNKALASVPYPYNFVAAALVGAAATANVAKIAGVGSFEQGGIVPGSSFTGDNLQANVNSGEMILNRSQQSQLFNQANGGGSNNQDLSSIVEAIRNINITLMADDNQLATSVSRGVANGIILGRSE